MRFALFPDSRRKVTSLDDQANRLWDLETGVMLKKMEGHGGEVWALAVSRNRQMIADRGGKIIVWHGKSRESLT
jgi:WD40 repeat protein